MVPVGISLVTPVFLLNVLRHTSDVNVSMMFVHVALWCLNQKPGNRDIVCGFVFFIFFFFLDKVDISGVSDFMQILRKG